MFTVIYISDIWQVLTWSQFMQGMYFHVGMSRNLKQISRYDIFDLYFIFIIFRMICDQLWIGVSLIKRKNIEPSDVFDLNAVCVICEHVIDDSDELSIFQSCYETHYWLHWPRFTNTLQKLLMCIILIKDNWLSVKRHIY